ncbi:4Fe-4S double cluster binding domain-containing protein [Thermodesulfobacteriota bacterium]
MPLISVSIKNIELGINSLKENPKVPKNYITDETLEEFEKKALKLGVNKVGFTKLSAHHIFKNHSVLYDNLIVIIKEMDKERVDLAPSFETFKMIHQTYASLGVISNKLSKYLRDKGFAAQAGSALNGMSVYPILAQNAGLGCIGKNGLLITPKFGPRQRIAVIYTSIKNQPFNTGNKHTWISEYCRQCNACIKKCPAKAIYETPIVTNQYNTSHINSEKCFAEFYDNYGCSICIKVCPFSKRNYDKLKNIFQNRTII